MVNQNTLNQGCQFVTLCRLTVIINTITKHKKMNHSGVKNTDANLSNLGIKNFKHAYWNLAPEILRQHTLDLNQGSLTDNGTLVVHTGKFTGRSPKDRFIVKDDITSGSVDWGEINQPFDAKKFDVLQEKICNYLADKDLYIKDAFACSENKYQLNVRLVAEYPWSAKFVQNMFNRLNEDEMKTFTPEWNILCAPGFKADPEIDGTRQSNFAVINFTKKTIIIGGTGYTGEIKKGIFSVLNFVLPQNHNVFPMHCSANVGKGGDTAIFFGLSGTGKTTLSADPKRNLIGDDEHGWSNESVFNFEGGCYAKTINLSAEKEPDIFKAIRPGALLENIGFQDDQCTPDYDDDSITQNTRVSYPIYHIENAQPGSKATNPKNIFFLTCDAFGVLPPISKLSKAQAMYYFLSGYTAKIAGTEEGIVEPQATFSACFGAPFLPLHPTKYADMLGEKMAENNVNVWLINTGWTGGAYGIGSRISLKYTRSMITAVLNGDLNELLFTKLAPFNLSIPMSCPNVPREILNPKNTWENGEAFDIKANEVADLFHKNFLKYADQASEEIKDASPNVLITV